MASLDGIEYDVFISYRHNDNLDGWVTEFVQNLEKELRATIKEPITIYFDQNPHDGLLESHHVDKSLEGKLKCLIFIPILSQTYCDPKSFAWQHEFCAFNRAAQADTLGRDIRLRNGNVASRILPVRIHDLDAQDQAMVEQETGSVLRAIDFIYKEPGVNRPLEPLDGKGELQGKSNYRNQVNKVANAIKELLQAVHQPIILPQQSQSKQPSSLPVASIQNKLIFALSVVALITVASIYFVSNKPDSPLPGAEADKSLVVLPFSDLSPEKDQDWFSNGVIEEILNKLTGIPELKLVSQTTSFTFKNKNLSARQIADTLGVTYVLEGSVRKAGDQLRITAQLIHARDDRHLWSQTYDYQVDSIFKVQDDIANKITKVLNILLDESTKLRMKNSGTSNIDAYQAYLKGASLYRKAHTDGILDSLVAANVHFENAIALDKTFSDAYFLHADPFIHSIIGKENVRPLTDMPEQQRLQQMNSDFSLALHHAKSPIKQVSYQYAHQYFSSDWRNIRSFYEKNKDILLTGWQELLVLIDPVETARRNLNLIKTDPFAQLSRGIAANCLAQLSLADSALHLYDNQFGKGVMIYMFKSRLYTSIGDYSRACELLEEKPYDFYALTAAQLLAGKSPYTRQQLYDSIRSKGPWINSYGASPMEVFNILGEYDKADSIAAINDRRLLGHVSLVNSIVYGGQYFHLTATPNLTARLRELGIDPAAFERKHYKQFPVVRLK